LLRVLTNYDDEQVDNLTEQNLYDAYIIWSNKEAAALQRNRSVKRGKKSGKDKTPPTRKRKSSAEAQREIYEMNKYGNTYIPVEPSSPIPNITTPPPGMTPIGHNKKHKNDNDNDSINKPPQTLFPGPGVVNDDETDFLDDLNEEYYYK